MAKSKVFISYRRGDSQDAAGRIFDRLSTELGRDAVFMDVDTIPVGVDFREHVRQSVQQCDILLAIIGGRWLNATDDQGKRRLQDKNDYVRIEIELALQREKALVVPVLIHGAEMPMADQLPSSLQKLPYLNAAEVRHAHFQADLDRLVKGLCAHQSDEPTPLPRGPARPPQIRKRAPTKPKSPPGPPPKKRQTSERKSAKDGWHIYFMIVLTIAVTFFVAWLVIQSLGSGWPT